MKFGIICPSEIAIRRFMPALQNLPNIDFVGVGVNSIQERFGNDIPSKEVVQAMLDLEIEKANIFIDSYGGKIFKSYEELVTSDDIEAIYIPLPPALHYKWAKLALENQC